MIILRQWLLVALCLLTPIALAQIAFGISWAILVKLSLADKASFMIFVHWAFLFFAAFGAVLITFSFLEQLYGAVDVQQHRY